MIGIAFAADVALAAGSIGILVLVARRFSGTSIVPPFAIMCASGSALGITSALVEVAAGIGGPTLAHEFHRATYVGASCLGPSFIHLLTLYPRPLENRWVKWAVGGLYMCALARALLAPTDLLVAGYETGTEVPVPVPGPLYAPTILPIYLSLIPATGWLAYLAVKGQGETERPIAQALLFAVVPAAFFLLALPNLGYPAGSPDAPDTFSLAFGWGILFSGAAVYSGWLRPPVPKGLQAVLDASTDAILVIDQAGRVSTANEAARNLVPGEPRRLEGAAIEEALPVDLFETGAGDLLRMDVMGVLRGRIDRNTHQLRGPEEGSRNFVVTVLPIGEAEGGGARGALVIMRDETARIALEDASRRLAELQDLVIRVLGHDVKTPLAVIQGYAELSKMQTQRAMSADEAAGVGRNLDKMMESVSAIHVILSNARAISRFASGPGAPIELQQLSIDDMAKRAVELMRPVAEGKRLTLKMTGAARVSARVPKGFESVIMNLLSNAVKYTPPGGAVDVAVERQGDIAVIRVSDTGPGIAPEERDKLFRKFERLSAEKGGVEGHGLGLSIVRTFLEFVEGTVRVEDRRDGRSGSVFVVEIPFAEPPPNGG